MPLTKAVSKGINDGFRLMVIGFMFSPQLNSELQLLLLNWLGYISCLHFKMTFLLKNKTHPDISWGLGGIWHCCSRPTLSFYMAEPRICLALLSLGDFHHPAYDMRQRQDKSKQWGKRDEKLNISAAMMIIKIPYKSTEICFILRHRELYRLNTYLEYPT